MQTNEGSVCICILINSMQKIIMKYVTKDIAI